MEGSSLPVSSRSVAIGTSFKVGYILEIAISVSEWLELTRIGVSSRCRPGF